ncbi:hypothetical protein ERO13_D11G186300v2 [Gossypium hirsutum]|uniref:Uncharacterized protein isoform X2 n=2 Tax=Gossypium TaxID=3633 RepID=A0ABM3B5T8_GOSHI|nr:uncharacterized protein LOC107913027 isoform X2 [Gossypium hirsutum]KAG4121114.1 hypothetical protein ERO13_D11G186300v2 [Gossypium hirsutum]TYH44582.1 hypothetical protein ES332_D11G204900v1 [Gossypium tomentosum]
MSALPASVSSSSSWIPEDDLLLKNAIESGASLEALAKGAVRFSRKFTVKELQDRWRALLYDPVISDQAAARMIEVELSASNLYSKSSKCDNSVENGSAKRKFESVRRSYYAMRKRACNYHVTNSSGVSFLGSPNGNDCMQNRGGYDELVEPREDCVQNQFGFCDLGIGCVDKRSQDNDLKVTLKEDCFSEKVENLEQNNVSSGSPHVIFEASVKFGHPSGVEEIKPFSVGCSSPQPDMPLWKTMEDVPAAVMPVNDGPLDKGQDVEGEIVHPEDVDGGDLAETDALLNFDGDAIDKSCYESVNSLLLNSPNDVHEDDTSKTKEHETLVSDMCPGTLEAATYSSKLDEVPDQQSHSGHTEQLYSGHPEINVPSSASVSNPHSPELNDEGCCMLNSEDPEIPCNDDVLLAKAFAPQECHKVGSDQASSFANQNDSKEELSLMQTEDNLAQCFTAPKMVGLDLLSESSQAAKSEFHDGQCHVISRQAQNSLVDPYRFKTSHAFPNSAANGATKEEPSDECNTKDISTYAEASSIVDSVLEAEANKTTFDQIEYGSEDDVPSFSDLEAMILEMDLCPDESDSFIRSEVSRYQDEHTRKTLIRLEQCARSAMQRATTSRGALAVLYGRHMKHYIKETEVVLGRATMDVDVDIDLGREGRANKISRRQAIIKMEGDGSFSLKNLGKSSIFLNGKEVSTGQLMGLVSSSLIEIRDMAFVFEINQNSVKRHLAKITPKKQEKKTAFDFPEEPKKVLHE